MPQAIAVLYPDTILLYRFMIRKAQSLSVRAYDLVYSRFLLQHLSRPVELLPRMWAAVRAGGVIAVEDADFDGPDA